MIFLAFILIVLNQSTTFSQLNASVLSVSFDKPQIIRGVETVTATITIKNTGNISGTFYLTASLEDINSTWYDFIPTRTSKTLAAGSSGTVSVIWAPNSNVPIGSCYFYMKVFKASSGTDYYTDYEKSSAFSVIGNPNPFPLTKGRMIFHRNTKDYATLWNSKLFMYDFSKNVLEEISSNWNIDNPMNAHFSPDGSKIVFMGDIKVEPRDWDIFIWTVGSSDQPTNLTNKYNKRD